MCSRKLLVQYFLVLSLSVLTQDFPGIGAQTHRSSSCKENRGCDFITSVCDKSGRYLIFFCILCSEAASLLQVVSGTFYVPQKNSIISEWFESEGTLKFSFPPCHGQEHLPQSKPHPRRVLTPRVCLQHSALHNKYFSQVLLSRRVHLQRSNLSE